MKALDRKLMRDLGRLWAQALTIALVVGCGIASFVALRGTYASLVDARDRYYDDRRFADVFAHLERAPDALALRLEAVRGVARVYTRIVDDVLLPVEGLSEPAVGRIVSLPEHGEPPLDAIRVRRGRLPEPGRSDEVVVLEAFADAHHLEPGGTLPAVLNGTRRDLTVVGIAMSPEFVFAVGGASYVQDPKRFAVLWMDRGAVAPAFRMEGSFDDVLISLQPGASERAVLDDVRRLLEPYGVLTVTGRDKQMSNLVLTQELDQLRAYAVITPAIFLGVAAFLLNVVLARTLHLQRGQIATLKAVGYRDSEIARHYVELVLVIVAAGAALGIGLGDVLGRGMIHLYRPYFAFPDLAFSLDPGVAATGVLVSLASGLAGALGAVRRAVRVAPAEAMQAEVPPVYRRPLVERLGLARVVGPAGRMVLREISRQPVRAALSCVGVAWATAIVVAAYFMNDAMDYLVASQFQGAQREDVEVAFREPMPVGVVNEVKHLPGVLEVEPRWTVPVRVRFDQRHRDTAVVGAPRRDVPLRTVAEWPPGRFEPPPFGVALSAKLADVLGVRPGERVTLEVLEGDRRVVDVPVTALANDTFGLFAYASLDTLRQLMGAEGDLSSVLVTVLPEREDALLRRLATIPQVASVARRSDALEQFRAQAEDMVVTMSILTAFGAVIAFGVVYNQARIALSMRSRELASLRVLGFTRAEISAVLLGELAVYVAIGVPVGLLLGRWLLGVIAGSADPESYRLPAFASARTYAFAVVVTVIAAGVSALVVRRRLDRLDLVGVLKSRE